MKTPGRYISVDGINTHYFEGGRRSDRPSVLLLHSAEFGGAAEISWQYNFDAVAEHFHVVAPDHLGFGRSDKMFDFGGQFDRRIRHIQGFLEVMKIREVFVVGSSMSGGLSLTVAARETPDWPIRKLVTCSGGGFAPANEARDVLNSYDGTAEHMRRIIEVMFIDPKWARDEAYIARRQELATLPGAWEATAAARFKAPFRDRSGPSERESIDYTRIRVPCLVMAGAKDPLRLPGYAPELAAQIPGARLHVFEEGAHMPNIECADEFNRELIRFLKEDA
ncbi:MAG: alpha/beta fold hydrolase [Alphaproteobacteria bacterium]|nr:alpha/beta fold hydrolase [Alphaproteobacteria bacterium]